MSNQLAFNSTQLSTLNRNNQVWLSSAELAKALQYKSAKSVTNIFNSNSDEFTPLMTEVIESVTSGNLKVSTRIFSLRGCHLIAMFSRTKIAKEFRKWVLDILDKQVGEISTINTEQKYQIRKAVNERVHRTGEKHQAIYHKLYDQFKINSYESLPASQFDEAIDFLGGINARSGLSDNDLYKLARLFVMADRMHSKIADITPALEKMFSKYADSFHSMAFHYTRELKEAKQIIQRETSHINTAGYLDDWNRVLPVIRH